MVFAGLPHPAGSAVLPCSSVLLLWSWVGLVVAAPELQRGSRWEQPVLLCRAMSGTCWTEFICHLGVSAVVFKLSFVGAN